METEQDERELTELQSKRYDSSDGDKKREKTLTNPLIGQMNGHKTMCKKCSIKEPTMTVNCATEKCEPNECVFTEEENGDETWSSDDNDSEETKTGATSDDSDNDNSDDVMLSGSIERTDGSERKESRSLRRVRFALANVMRENMEQSEEEETNEVKPENKGRKRKRGKRHETQRNEDSDALRTLEITRYWDKGNKTHKESSARGRKARNARRARQRQKKREEKQKQTMEKERLLQREQEENEREQEEREKYAESGKQENKHCDHDDPNAKEEREYEALYAYPHYGRMHDYQWQYPYYYDGQYYQLYESGQVQPYIQPQYRDPQYSEGQLYSQEQLYKYNQAHSDSNQQLSNGQSYNNEQQYSQSLQYSNGQHYNSEHSYNNEMFNNLKVDVYAQNRTNEARYANSQWCAYFDVRSNDNVIDETFSNTNQCATNAKRHDQNDETKQGWSNDTIWQRRKDDNRKWNTQEKATQINVVHHGCEGNSTIASEHASAYGRYDETPIFGSDQDHLEGNAAAAYLGDVTQTNRQQIEPGDRDHAVTFGEMKEWLIKLKEKKDEENRSQKLLNEERDRKEREMHADRVTKNNLLASCTINILAIIFFLILSQIQQTVAYEAFDCQKATVERVDSYANFLRNSPDVAIRLKEHEVLRIWQNNISEGKMLVLINPAIWYGNVTVYQVKCERVQVTHIRSTNCYYKHATEAKRQNGDTIFVDNEYYIVQNPAKIHCPSDRENTNDEKEEVIAKVFKHQNQKHTIASLDQMINHGPEEEPHILNNKERIRELASAIDNATYPDDGDHLGTFVYLYKHYVGEAVVFYSAGYAIYTFVLMTCAAFIGISWDGVFRLSLAPWRRFSDLWAYNKERKRMIEIERKRKLRESAGLSINLPHDQWTNKHLLRIYEAIEELNLRIDLVEEIQQIQEGSPDVTDVSSENGGNATNASESTNSSTESNPISIRERTPSEEARREGRYNVRYHSTKRK